MNCILVCGLTTADSDYKVLLASYPICDEEQRMNMNQNSFYPIPVHQSDHSETYYLEAGAYITTHNWQLVASYPPIRQIG